MSLIEQNNKLLAYYVQRTKKSFLISEMCKYRMEEMIVVFFQLRLLFHYAMERTHVVQLTSKHNLDNIY